MHVLGDFTVTVDDRVVTLGGPRQKAVLARMLAGADETVSVEQIVDDVWGERSAESTVASVHAYVSRLRRLLGSDAIPRRAGRYQIDRDVVTVDADLFIDDVSRGRAALARGADDAAAALLQAALARWRGPDAFGPMREAHFLVPLAARWEELRVLAAEALADAHARGGRSGDDVALLHELAARDPLRESLAVRLVRALYAAGRQADALAAFERCRHALAEQLGVDPTPELRRVHAAVLAQEPLPSTVSSVLPTNLPPRNRSFVGREDVITQVGSVLDDDARRPRAVALVGLPGVGKTELALELAHRRRRTGRVAWWIAAEDPAGTATGLADLAAALGIVVFERSAMEDGATHAALWAELDRAPGWVLVFDNADDPALLEPFLPAARHGDVVITSRNPAWRRLGRPVTVAPLRRAESVRYVLDRTGDPTAEADTLAEQLGDLPLALEQACAYIEQTGMSVPDYVELFRERRESLLLRDPLDSRPTIATTWGLAFDRLHQRSPRAAGVLEAMAFLAPDAVTVATLLRLGHGNGPDMFVDELDLHDALAELLRLSLIDRESGVVRVHRLVQDVVRARMPVGVRRRRLVEAGRACTGRDADTEDVAAHLVSLAAHAEALGTVPDGLVGALAELARRQAARALYPAAQRVLEAALRLQDRMDDPVLHGRLVCQLGEVLDAAGYLGPALDLHRRAVRILDSTLDPDDVVLAHAYNRLGHVLNCADDAVAAIEAHERALLALQKAARDDLVPPVLIDLGYTLWAAGRLGPAGEALRAGQMLLEGQGRRDDRDWAHATAGLGMVEQDTDHLEDAVALQRTALDVFTRVCGPDHPDTAQTLDKLGYALRLSGRAIEAVEVHLRAVRLLERVLGTDDSRVAMTLTNLGLAYTDAGRIGEAVEAQARARRIFNAALGPEHASTLLASRRLAVALAVSGNHVRARKLMNAVVEVAERRLEDNPAELARVAADAAQVLGSDTV